MLFELAIGQEADLQIGDATECGSSQLHPNLVLARIRRTKKRPFVACKSLFKARSSMRTMPE